MKLTAKIINKIIWTPFYKSKMGSCGHNLIIGHSTEFLNASKFHIGNDFYCGPYCYFSTNNYFPVTIGDSVMFGPGIKVLGGNHDIEWTESHMRYNTRESHSTGEIVIGSGAWIGAGSIILSKANIGEGAIIGAGSVVNSNIPPYSIAAGVPARFIKNRFKDKDELKKLLGNIESKLNIETIVDR